MIRKALIFHPKDPNEPSLYFENDMIEEFKSHFQKYVIKNENEEYLEDVFDLEKTAKENSLLFSELDENGDEDNSCYHYFEI